jgi:hypothetical protein
MQRRVRSVGSPAGRLRGGAGTAQLFGRHRGGAMGGQALRFVSPPHCWRPSSQTLRHGSPRHAAANGRRDAHLPAARMAVVRRLLHRGKEYFDGRWRRPCVPSGRTCVLVRRLVCWPRSAHAW